MRAKVVVPGYVAVCVAAFVAASAAASAVAFSAAFGAAGAFEGEIAGGEKAVAKVEIVGVVAWESPDELAPFAVVIGMAWVVVAVTEAVVVAFVVMVVVSETSLALVQKMAH